MDSTLADKFMLSELVARLNRAIDRGLVDEAAACYTDDAIEAHGPFSGAGRDYTKRALQGVERDRTVSDSYHLLGQSLFDVSEDRAIGETYYIYVRAPHADTPTMGYGRYLDCFVRQDDRWRVKHRRLVLDWYGDSSGRATDFDQYLRSTRDSSDPLFDKHKC